MDLNSIESAAADKEESSSFSNSDVSNSMKMVGFSMDIQPEDQNKEETENTRNIQQPIYL